jgi:hypothetical protein
MWTHIQAFGWKADKAPIFCSVQHQTASGAENFGSFETTCCFCVGVFFPQDGYRLGSASISGIVSVSSNARPTLSPPGSYLTLLAFHRRFELFRQRERNTHKWFGLNTLVTTLLAHYIGAQLPQIMS